MSRRLSEDFQVIALYEARDNQDAIDSDSVNMALLSGLNAIFSFGAITGDSVLKVSSGATAGAKTTDLAFTYRHSGGDFKATNADVFGAFTAVANTGLTLTAATFDHTMIEVEIDSIALPDGHSWLTFSLDGTATVLLSAAVGVGRPRYTALTQPTAL